MTFNATSTDIPAQRTAAAARPLRAKALAQGRPLPRADAQGAAAEPTRIARDEKLLGNPSRQ